MIFALVPAAGHSTRMGRPKLSLPLGSATVLEQVVRTLRQAGVEHVLVVVGPHVPELVPLAERAGARALLLGEATPDMRATVQQGLRWLEDQFHPAEQDAWLLVPADHPALRVDTVRAVLTAAAASPDRTIVVPTFGGRRGHPTLLRWPHVAGIRSLPGGSGLNGYLRQHAGETLELALPDADVLHDLDTPEDYERLRRSWQSGPAS